MSKLAESASQQLLGVLRSSTIRPIEKHSFKDNVADSAQAFLIDGILPEHDCVLALSNPNFPNFIALSACKAQEAKLVLNDPLGEAVCAPLLTGEWNGRSYAIYNRLTGYSSNRYVRRLQVLRSGRKVLSWLSDVYHETKSQPASVTDKAERFLEPLEFLVSDEEVDSTVRNIAGALESMTARGGVRTFNCLEHGDFWIGNVLFHRSPGISSLSTTKQFKVIDWAGSDLAGYPGIDALRFAMSAYGQGRLASGKLEFYCKSTGLTKLELSLYCLCALGSIGANLNQFPKDRFNALALRTVRFLTQHHFLEQ